MGINLTQKELSIGEVFSWVDAWVKEEAAEYLYGVLATIENNAPYTRTVAVREIDERGMLFFTQKGSRKVGQLDKNGAVSFTLPLYKKERQITLRGEVVALSGEENDGYWATYPRISQLRFMVYGTKSGQEIWSNDALDEELGQVTKEHADRELARPEAYVGYRVVPVAIEFYQLNDERMSDSFRLRKNGKKWELQRVVS